MASKLDVIMTGFGIEKEPDDTSKDISEDVEKASNNFKVNKATVEETEEPEEQNEPEESEETEEEEY